MLHSIQNWRGLNVLVVLTTYSIREKYKMSNTHFSALFLLYEHDKPDSLWRPYFDVLPSTFDTTLYWTDEELKALEGSDLGHFSQSRNSMVKRGYERSVATVLQENTAVFPRHFTYEEWKVRPAT